MIESVVSSRRVYDGRILALRDDSVRLPDGRTTQREIVEHAEVVAIVPVDAARNVLLVRQYRLAAGEALLEVPAGGVDTGEGVEAAAQRELREETGFRAERLERLCGFYASPGYCTEFIHVFLAMGLTEDPLDGVDDEDVAVERTPLAEALNMVERREIKDGKSIIGLMLADSHIARR